MTQPNFAMLVGEDLCFAEDPHPIDLYVIYISNISVKALQSLVEADHFAELEKTYIEFRLQHLKYLSTCRNAAKQLAASATTLLSALKDMAHDEIILFDALAELRRVTGYHASPCPD